MHTTFEYSVGAVRDYLRDNPGDWSGDGFGKLLRRQLEILGPKEFHILAWRVGPLLTGKQRRVHRAVLERILMEA